MLDKKFIVENADRVALAAEQRGVACSVADFVAAETQRKKLETQLQEISAAANALAKDSSLSPDDKKGKGSQLKQERQALKTQADELDAKVQALHLEIPNLIHPESPIGADESASKEIKLGKTAKKEFSFEVKDHVALGEALGIFDFASASKTAGAGFYYLLGDGVRLELALQNFALHRLSALGFTPVITPELVRESILTGAGYMPRGDESNSYQIEGTDLHLIATSEIPLCGMFADKIIQDSLPIKLAGLSHCFRSERAAGSTNRGLFRVHQFSKVEMFVLCQPEESEKIHQDLLAIECEIYDALELPYRVIDVASGDLGAPAYRKFDIEAWLPARKHYAEITSASNCTDYQARRLKIRFKGEAGAGNQHPHILNGTAIALARTMIALLENHQQEDGSILIPEKLQNFFGGNIIKNKG